jgi:hypothetical protein
MEIQRSAHTGLHPIVTERDRARAAQSVQNLRHANEEMEDFILTARNNWQQRRKVVVVVGTVTTLGLIGLGLALFMKPSPIQ